MADEAESGVGLRIVFLGPPGSGKGTQAERLAKSRGIPAISTGEMLRSAVAAGSELGHRVSSIMASGALVDDATMAEVVEERLAQHDAGQGFILDGYPRTAAQVATLDSILDRQGAALDHVLFLQVDLQALVERALARGREDDGDEVVKERLRVYQRNTAPLVDTYRERGLLREVDGNSSIDEVTASLEQILG